MAHRILPSPENTVKSFGRLKRIGPWFSLGAPRYAKAAVMQCECGVLCVCRRDNLVSGKAKSCGCLKNDLARVRMAATAKKHGLCREHHSEVQIWHGMMKRCYDTENRYYSRWGGRGIVVCSRWRASIANFIADLGPRPSKRYTLDRIDNDGPYSPENCRWATLSEQNNNTSRNHSVTINGVTKTVAQWSRQKGASPSGRIYARLGRGWTAEEAVFGQARSNHGRIDISDFLPWRDRDGKTADAHANYEAWQWWIDQKMNGQLELLQSSGANLSALYSICRDLFASGFDSGRETYST